MADNEKAVPLAISLPETLISEIDRVAADVKDSRSGVMRRAIREGLPVVMLGGNADAIVLDSGMSADVDTACKETGLSRTKILLGAIQAGFEAFVTREISEKLSLAEMTDPKDKELILREIEKSYRLYDNPMVIECRRLIAERGDATTRLMDILQHVPEAKRRNDAVQKLTELRRLPDGPGGGPAWMSGLSTEYIEWEIEMFEKYGANLASWPESEKEAANAAEDARKAKPETPKKQRK